MLLKPVQTTVAEVAQTQTANAANLLKRVKELADKSAQFQKAQKTLDIRAVLQAQKGGLDKELGKAIQLNNGLTQKKADVVQHVTKKLGR